MSQENVETVKQAIAEVNARDIDGYLARCTEDIELLTPLGPIGGTYEGPEDIRRFFADIEDTSPDFRLDLEHAEAIDKDRVLAFMRTSASGGASGIPTELRREPLRLPRGEDQARPNLLRPRRSP